MVTFWTLCGLGQNSRGNAPAMAFFTPPWRRKSDPYWMGYFARAKIPEKVTQASLMGELRICFYAWSGQNPRGDAPQWPVLRHLGEGKVTHPGWVTLRGPEYQEK